MSFHPTLAPPSARSAAPVNLVEQSLQALRLCWIELRGPGVESTSAGTNHDAENPVTAELVGWAEVIVVMERQHRAKISKRFGKELRGRRVVCLDIPDNYEFMQPELIELLKVRARRFLPATRALR